MPKKKKNKGKKKKSPQKNNNETQAQEEEIQPAPETTVSTTSAAAVKDRQQTLRELSEALYKYPKRTKKEDPNYHHEFWDNQPVPRLDEDVTETGPIETKTVDQVRQQPYVLPSNFEWYCLDLTNKADLDDLYNLLSQHYVEDDDNMFRFNYSRPFLQWALMPPEFKRQWHLSVRVKSNKKLVACITAIPAKIRVHDDQVDMVEINFLCVHKKLRTKRLAPVLIKEITRRVNLEDIWQAAYTAGVVIPKPVARNQYWHRSFDPRKLVEIGFSSVPRNSTMARMIHLSRVPEEPSIPMRPMVEADAPQVCKILSEYLLRFKYTPILNTEEVKHWFLPRENVIQTYVKEEDGVITDMFSYYCLSSHVIGNDKHKLLNAVYSYYNVANTVEWSVLMENALVVARRKDDKDVFNCLNVMDNKTFLLDLKFGPGDGYLHYYLYNWKCPKMEPGDVGLVLM